MHLSRIVPSDRKLLNADLLKLDFQAFVIVVLHVFVQHAAVPLEVGVRIHSLNVTVLSFFELASSVVILFVNWGEIDILIRVLICRW